jgi:hypothetical protein
MGCSTIALIAANAAAIGPLPVPVALRSRIQGPVRLTSAVAETVPHNTYKKVSW